jgi:proline dehydrogenase
MWRRRFRTFRKDHSALHAGESIDEAVAAIKDLNARGCSASFDHLNESVGSVAETEGEVTRIPHILSRSTNPALTRTSRLS